MAQNEYEGRQFVSLSKEMRREEILRYLLMGHSLKECATLCQISYGAAQGYVKDPTFQARLKALSKEVFAELDKQISLTKVAVADRVNELSEKALDRMAKIIEGGGDNVAYKACQDILDRNPEVPRNRQLKADVTTRVFNPADLLRAAAVASELDQVGTVIEGRRVGESRDESNPPVSG